MNSDFYLLSDLTTFFTCLEHGKPSAGIRIKIDFIFMAPGINFKHFGVNFHYLKALSFGLGDKQAGLAEPCCIAAG